MRLRTVFLMAISMVICSIAFAADKPLKVYILAGQSNMEGQARVETFDYIGDDPATAPLLREMRGPDGKARVCENVWISYLTGSPERGVLGEGTGKLTAGYGARSKATEDGGKIGPEFTFGIAMEKTHDGPILIIKTAWGGKSLHTDFRPPSAGPYRLNAFQKKLYYGPKGHGVPEDPEKWLADKGKATGRYYRLMMEHVKKVLADPKRVCPAYDAKLGYEIAGFVWFQGWNDYCDGHSYPDSHKPGGYDNYSKLLRHFIGDVRKDLAAPAMPFLIGVMGVGGPIEQYYIPRYKKQNRHFRRAMAAPAEMDEFIGNVVAVETAPYWEKPLADIELKHEEINHMAYLLRTENDNGPNKDGDMTREQQQAYLREYRAKLITPEDDALWKRGASNQGYHYFGCAKTYAQIGKAFAEALLSMEQGHDTAQSVTFADNTLSNGIVSVVFDYSEGSFSILETQSGEVLLSEAQFGLPSGKRGGPARLMSVEDVQEPLGKGRRIVLEVVDRSVLRYYERARHLFSYTLYENSPALVLGFGLKTPNYFSMRLRGGEPLAGGSLFGGKDIEKAMTLNGAAGAEKTLVTAGLLRSSANSLMLTGLIEGQRRTAVWGGLEYNEFGKYSILQDGSPGLFAEDPVGRLVDEDQTYLAADTFYVDVYTREPFEALERCGWAMRLANNAHPNVYDFPVLCGWSTGVLSKLPGVNNSAKLVGELEHANKCGLTKYTKVSLRLEPDKYHFDTEQGWWDDAHMRKFNHLVEPYESIAKWSAAMNARNGIPYIYMQLGMPSDDFARQFPQYMLFNDSSEVDKRVPGKTWKNKHPHNQPYVTYDYTDEEFSKHFVKVWSKLRQDGIYGVKVDYPATAWRPEGGFDDRYATCNGAYRRAFKLLREAMGADGLIDERNLGESGRPCLDMTAGLVDTQRTWTDSNKYAAGMVSISGLRWYKNRTVFNYYPDTKAVHDLSPEIRQSMLTMVYLTSGRIDLSTSFSLFTPEITHDFSRIYPHYPEPKTARSLDAFTGILNPQVYDLELTTDWHQIALYNTTEEKTVVSTAISGDRVNNAIGLDSTAEYHAYEFWSDTYLGKLGGTARIERELSPNHCAMISLRKAYRHPQVISTNRHILQGWVDLADVRWDAEKKTLGGTARVIGGEPFKIVVANNGGKVLESDTQGEKSELEPHSFTGLSCLTLSANSNKDVKWIIKYE